MSLGLIAALRRAIPVALRRDLGTTGRHEGRRRHLDPTVDNPPRAASPYLELPRANRALLVRERLLDRLRGRWFARIRVDTNGTIVASTTISEYRVSQSARPSR